MTVTQADQHPTWPAGDPGKVLLNCVVSLNVDSVFEELFGSYSDTQAKLHKQRSDTNCAESPWVSQRSQLPAQQFVWPAPPAGADPGTPAQGKFRKVRFDAAASLASKAFSSEEVQQVLQHSPGSHYQLLTEVSTTAMYGDTFTVISRYSLVGKGPARSHLHVAYAIEFKPSLSRLMKPMVAKGVDGGIRGSFSVLKKLLQEQYGLTDLPDTAPAPALPGAPAAAAAAAAAAVAAPTAAPVAAAGAPMLAIPAGPAPGLLVLADYLVYQELVASLVRVSDPQLIAKALAVGLTLVLINMLILLLRPVSQACAAASTAAGAAPSSGGLLGWACWPVTVLGLDIPRSLGEVLGALLLVAVANRLLLLAVELVATTLKGSPSPSAAASRAPSMLGAALSAVAAAASSSQPAATANGSPAGAAEPQAAAAVAAQGSSRADRQSPSGKPGLLSPRPRTSSPVGIPGKAANGASGGDGGGGGGGSGGGVEAALSNFSNTVTGWGRNLLNGSMVDSLSSNEGIKALVAGSWSKPSSSNDAGQGPGSAAAAAAGGEGAVRLSSAGSVPGPVRVPSHRHTSSFTAVMDPSGLNIIEDYDQQLTAGGSSSTQKQQQPSLPQLAEEHSGAASSPAASEVGVPAEGSSRAAAGARTQESSKGASGAAVGKGRPSSAAAAARSGSPSKMKRAGSSKIALSEADAEARQPLLSAASVGDDGTSVSSQAGGSSARAAGTGGQGAGGGSRPSTPAPGDEGSVPPLLDSASPIIVPQRADKAAQLQQQQQGVRSSKSVTFSRSPNPPDSTSGGHLSGTHSAATLLSAGAGRSAGGAAAVHSSTRSSPLARRSASPMLYGASPPPDVSATGVADSLAAGGRLRLSGMSASYEALSASSGSSNGGVYAPAVEPGAEEEDEVLVEVFEHERVQPFRGWGHTWPGHFLPSDKVGHWGDRTGAPGGAVSMLFDRVAPRLPPGWTWQDDEWRVDMTGAEWEGCDAEGWSYGMDFSWITWPPGPQMGKPGLKSFVRRRRWLRTRARLPPGAEAPDEDGPSQRANPVLVVPGYEAMEQQQGGSAPSSARDSDGGFMSGLGAGLGLVSHDSATAAAAAAGAMVSRFMKAVQDLPLAPRGSSAGSELSLSTSPPTSAPGAAAAGEAPAGSLAAAAAATSQDGGEDGASTTAASSKQQPQQAPGISSKSSNAGSSHRGGESGNVSASDSSSVNSDSPPPRPRLSEALADLRQAESAGLPQPAAAEAAAAIAAAAGEKVQERPHEPAAAEAAEAGTGSNAAAEAGTAATAAGAAKGVSSPQDEPAAGVSAEAGDAGSGGTAAAAGVSTAAPATEAVQGGVPVPPAAPVAVGNAAATRPDEELQEGLPAVGAAEVSGSTPQAAAATVTDEPVEVGGPVESPAADTAPAEAPAAASAGRDAAHQLDDKQQQHPAPAAATAATAAEPVTAASSPPPSATAAADEVVGAGTEQQAALEGAAAAGVLRDAAGRTTAATPTISGLAPTSSVGGGSAAGSGDWVWSAAAAVDASDQSALSAALPQRQQVLAAAGEGSELPSIPAAADRQPEAQGAGTVSRSSSGAASRGVVRTGSGARGSRGKASKLGAVPLRRSADGAAASSSGAGGGGAGSAAETAVGGVATASSRDAPALGSSSSTLSSSSGSRAAAVAAAELATAAAATARAPATVHTTGPHPRVSGDDMGSGMGWASSPDKQQQQPGRHKQQQSTSDEKQQAADRQQGWKEW